MISLGTLLAVGSGILWGVSTPLMKSQSSQLLLLSTTPKSEASNNFFTTQMNVLTSLAQHWKFLLCFCLNQLGSVLYTVSLAYNPITISVPISNSINLVIIVLVGCYKEKINLNLSSLTGVILVLLGVILCLISSH